MPTAFSEGEWTGRGQGNFLSLGWETILEVRQQYEDVEYYHIIIFPERTRKLYFQIAL